MKKIFSLCTVVVVLFTITASVYATEPEKNVVDLGDGFYMVETINQYSLNRTNNTISGSKTGHVYYDSTLVGTATLLASFDISGSAAKATKSSIEGNGYNGGIYVQGTSNRYGNTAFGTALQI